jgi:putative flippase GtrA
VKSITIKTFIKFIVVGGISTFLQYVLLIFFVEMSGLKPVSASLVSYFVSSVFNYFANYYITFQSGAKHSKSLSKFALIVCIGLILSGCLMYIFSELLNIYYLAAQTITTLIVLIWNFLSQKIWVFK